MKSQGWTPLIIDTNGNGKRDAYVEHKEPMDPNKDKRIAASFYGIMPSPVDDSIWGQAMDRGFSRIDQPGYIVRVVPGPDPANTALTEVYQPPEGTLARVASTSASMASCGRYCRAVTSLVSIASSARAPSTGRRQLRASSVQKDGRLYVCPGRNLRGWMQAGAPTMPITSG